MDDSYDEVNDPAITVKFELTDKAAFDPTVRELVNSVSFLAWTTTPWTIPANMALGVNKDLEYVTVAYE
jgi:isoleucyl-tRNA synthetase